MPSSAELLFQEGSRRLEAGDLVAAETALRAAIAVAPRTAEAHANLALVLERAARFDEAVDAYREAAAIAPDSAPIWGRLGTLLLARRRRLESQEALSRALRAAPESSTAWTELGLWYGLCGHPDIAERCHRRALELAPDDARAALNLATLLLREGRWDEGWPLFERRRGYEALASRLPMPRWTGEALAGRSVLIGVEAGLGDTIQFVRYATRLKERGARRVGVLAYPPLERLFRGAAGVDAVVPLSASVAPEDWDLWVPPMSLPGFFDTRVHRVPAGLPYLAPDPALVARWRGVLGEPGTARRIGLVWRGNPRFETDDSRSLPSPDAFAPLAALPGVEFVSLQHGAGDDELAAAPFRLANPMPGVADFADTAAIVAQLDLVVSVDTAVAHLAGALATPCALLLPDWNADWRWLEGRDDTPWYPGVTRLFRRSPGARWADAVAALHAELERALARS